MKWQRETAALRHECNCEISEAAGASGDVSPAQAAVMRSLVLTLLRALWHLLQFHCMRVCRLSGDGKRAVDTVILYRRFVWSGSE